MADLISISVLITAIGILVAIVNIMTEVLKKITWEKIPTSILAVFLSLVLTLVAFFAYCQINAVVVNWYYVAAAVIVGFIVAYAAMFGFDKLKEILQQFGVDTDSAKTITAASGDAAKGETGDAQQP